MLWRRNGLMMGGLGLKAGRDYIHKIILGGADLSCSSEAW